MNEKDLDKLATQLTIAAAAVSLGYTGYKAAGIKGAVITGVVPTLLLWLVIEQKEGTNEQDRPVP